MSVYEDVKRAIQEFLAPELAALKERVDQNEKRAQERYEGLKEIIEIRFDHIDRRFNGLEDKLALHHRLAIVEERIAGKKEGIAQ